MGPRGPRLAVLLLLLGLLGATSLLPAPGAAASPQEAALGNGRCNTPPCTCDDYGRLTCDCKDGPEELILTAEGERGLGRHTSRILVTDCPVVVLANHSLAQMAGLVSVDLVNVGNLSLTRHSFKLSQEATGARLSLRNCTLEVLPSNVFHGDVETIVLEAVHIGQVSAFAFANLVNTNRITLDNCRIEAVEALAFKKFDVRFLHVIGGSLGERQIPSRAINDIEVYDKFMLDGVRMGPVRSSAFIVKRPKTVAIVNCRVESLEGQAFEVSARGTVIIKNNSLGYVGFGAFLGIRADAESRPPGAPSRHSLLFKNNSLGGFEEGSLLFDRSSFRTEVSGVLVNRSCDCAEAASWRGQLLNYTGAHARLQGAGANAEAAGAEALLCLEGAETGVSLQEFETRACALGGSALLLGLGLAGLLVALGLAGCLAVCLCRRRRREARKRWISVPTLAPDVLSKGKNGLVGREGGGHHPTPGAPVDSRITMVVPDGRLYRETEFHVIVEKAEPLTTEL